MANLALVGFGTPANAAEHYRICVALMNDAQSVIITDPFANSDPRDVIEEKFSTWLSRNNLSVKNVQCQPPVPSDEAKVRVRTAVEFNRKIGNVPKMITFK